MPPVSPCGMQVDRLRSCYTTTARFFKDSLDTTTIRWYFVDNVPPIPFVHGFGSRNWEAYEGVWDNTLGEVCGADRPWANGSRVGDGIPDHVCGRVDQWQDGCLRADAIPPGSIDATGTPLCCERAFRLFASLGSTKSVFFARGLVRLSLASRQGLSMTASGSGRLSGRLSWLTTLSASLRAGRQVSMSLPSAGTLAAAVRGTAQVRGGLSWVETPSCLRRVGRYWTAAVRSIETLSSAYTGVATLPADIGEVETLKYSAEAEGVAADKGSNKGTLAGSMSSFSVVTPAGGCGSLPATLHCRTSGGTLGAAALNGLNVTMTYNSGLGNWMGTAVVSGQTETFTLLCMSGTWHCAILGVTWGGTGTASGSSGASPNLTSTVLANSGFTGQLLATFTRT